MIKLFFNFDGRVRRWSYFGSAILVFAAFGAGFWLLLLGAFSDAPSAFSFATVGALVDDPFLQLGRVAQLQPLGAVLGLALGAACVWSFVALSAKRLRDAGQSMYWMALALFLAPGTLMLVLLLFPSRLGQPLKELTAQ